MRGGLLNVVGVAALLAGGGVAGAETLRDALVQTYKANPTLMAERANVRTTDEIGRDRPRRRRGPSFRARSGVNQDLTQTGGGNGRNLSAGVNVSYPLFTGGRVRNSVRAAERAGRGRPRRLCARPRATSSPRRSPPIWT